MADIYNATADYPTPSPSTSRQSSTPAPTKMSATSSSNSTDHNPSAGALSNLAIDHPPAASNHCKSDIADTSTSTVFRNMSSHISKGNTWIFKSPSRLAYRMWTIIRKCVQSGSGCYILVEEVTAPMVEPIDEAFKNYGIRRDVRFTYEHDFNSLIIKCMSGIPHTRVSRSFISGVTSRIEGIPGHSEFSYHHTGNGRFNVVGKRSKEGDEGLAPAGTRDAETSWPSFVVEIGDSESLKSLRGDASWWLVNSCGQTRMVIIIKITKAPVELCLEQWVMVEDKSQRSTRSHQPKVPGRVNYWEIDAEGEVTHNKKSDDFDSPEEDPNEKKSEDLIIPYRMVFDIGHDNAMDIVISKAYMKQWALHQFKGLERR